MSNDKNKENLDILVSHTLNIENFKKDENSQYVKHFKGNWYKILNIAEHTETGEKMVVYQALYDDFKTYVRPLKMFAEKVDKVKYPKVEQVFRFEQNK